MPITPLCIALALTLLLCSCSESGAAVVDDPLAENSLVPASLPALSELKTPRCLLPDYSEQAYLLSYGGNALASSEELLLGTALDADQQAPHSYGIFGQVVPFNQSFLVCDLEPADGNETPGPYWLGVGNTQSERWEWYGPYSEAHNQVQILQGSGYANTDGVLLTAVVLQAGSGAIVRQVQVLWPGADGNEPVPPDDQALCVGPGRQYARIEDALAAATDGDAIKIYPQLGNAPYEATALFVTQANLRFFGMRSFDNQRPRVSGTGHEYSGVGSDPRAIFQFQPGADGCRVTGLELYDAHNESYNGAGIRVNQARDVLIDDCLIHGNDMGLMSNGEALLQTGSLRLEHSRIYENGSLEDPGYNHNIYAGGTRFVMEGCEVYGALTGHNVKSRAHINEISACYIHDSSNREFDLVDEAGNTDIPDSYSLISGCIIRKADPIDGNRNVIHFGQDGGNGHDGTLYLCNNTIITPYISAVVHFDAPSAKLAMYNCILWDGGSGQNGQSIAEATGGADIANARGGHNWLSSGFELPAGSSFDAPGMYFGAGGVAPPFMDSSGGDYRLLPAPFMNIVDAGLSMAQILPPPSGEGGAPLSIVPGQAYRPDFCSLDRPAHGGLDLGACESEYPGS